MYCNLKAIRGNTRGSFWNMTLMWTVILCLFVFPCVNAQDGVAVQATHIPTGSSGLWRLLPTSALAPSPSTPNRTSATDTTPTELSTPDGIQPIHTVLQPDDIRSTRQLMSSELPSPSGRMFSKSSANLHATNALPSSAAVVAADTLVHSSRHFITSTADVTTANDQSMFSTSVMSAVQRNVLDTNSLFVSVLMPNSDAYNSNLIADLASTIHASSSLFQPNHVTSIADGAAYSLTSKPQLLDVFSTMLNSATVGSSLLLNSAPIHSSVHVVGEIVPSLIIPTVDISSNIRLSSLSDGIFKPDMISSMFESTVKPTEPFSNFIKRTIDISPSYKVLSTINDSSKTTVSTVLETSVYNQVVLPSSQEQFRSNSYIFSSNSIDYSAMQSSENPPSFYSYTSHLLQASEQKDGTVYATSDIESTVFIESTITEQIPALQRTILDSVSSTGTILKLSTMVYQDSETIMSTMTVYAHATATPLLAQNSVTSTAIASTHFESLPVTVTDLITESITPSLPVDNVQTLVSDQFKSFVTSTVLEDSTIYLSPTVHSQLSFTTLSNFTALPVLPIIPLSSHAPYSSKVNSLEPSNDISTVDSYLTSTVFEPTTMLLTRKLTKSTILHASETTPLLTPHASTHQYSGSDSSLSSDITPQFVYSSVANESTRFSILPTATTGPNNLQLTSTIIDASESVLSSSSMESQSFLADSTMYVTLGMDSIIPTPLPMSLSYKSDISMQTLRSNSIIMPTPSSSEPIVSSITTLSPPLIPIELSVTSFPQSAQRSNFISATPSLVSSTLMAVSNSIPPQPPEKVSTSDNMILMTSAIPSIGGFEPTPSVYKIEPTASSGVMMIMPSPTPNPVVEPTEEPLDTSFATKPYWISFDINLKTHPIDFDPMTPSFVRQMEENLVEAYLAGKAEQDQRNKEVQMLLDDLNPDNDPLMNKRRRRAVTIDGITAQVIDISRTEANSPDATLVCYVVNEGVKVPANACQDTMNELTNSELTHFLGVVVKGGARVYTADPVTTPPPILPSANNYLVWFIPLIIVIGICLFFCCCCWFYCFCCRVPPSKRQQQQPEGPMDPETLKMLKVKSKPNRSNDQNSTNTTPRGFDVAKEGLGNLGLNMDDESKKSLNGHVMEEMTSITATHEEPVRSVPKVHKRGDAIPYGKVIESASSQSSDTDSSPYVSSLRSVRGDKDNLLKSELVGSRSISPGSSVNIPAKKSTKIESPRKSSDIQEKENKKHAPKQRKRNQELPSPQNEDGEEFKRVYMEAQKEISKILEPDRFTADGSLPKGKRRRSSSKSKRQTTSSSSETDFESALSELPETHLSRSPISPKKKKHRRARSLWESTLERQESLQDAKRRVHALIDEAFSLVSVNSNVVGPAPTNSSPNESSAGQPKVSRNPKARSKRHSQSRPPTSSPPIHEVDEPPLFERRAQSPDQTPTKAPKSGSGSPSDTTRVVIVPVNHIPDQTARNVTWNPYDAEDEINRLNESQLNFVPGMTGGGPKVPPKPKPRRSTPPAINQVLPPLHNLPETSLQQSNHGAVPHRHHRHSGASSGSETGGSGWHVHPGNPKRTRNTNRNGAGGYISPMNSPSTPPRNFAGYSPRNSPSTPPRNFGGYSPSTPPRTSHYSPLHHHSPPETDLLSTVAKEQRIGKPIRDDYDELDMTNTQGKSQGLANAVREELQRMQRRGADPHERREIGPL